MGRWTERYGDSVSVKGGWTSTHVAEIHNADCATYEARIAELERRLDAVVAMLEPGDKPNCMDSKYNPAGRVSIHDADRMLYDERRRNHARAVAIAEGRDNG